MQAVETQHVTEEPLSTDVVAQWLKRYQHSDCGKGSIIRMLCRSHEALREKLRGELERVKREQGVSE